MRSLYKKLLLIWMLCLPIWLSGQVLTGEIVSISQPGCTPPITGEIEVGGINGTPPYTYTLDGTVIQATGLFSDLILGDHSIVINDEAGDTFTIPFTIEITSQLQINVIEINNVTCFGQNDGYVSVIATSGVAPFQFSIDGGSTFQTSGTFNNLVNGEYQIIGIDNLGCADTVLAEVDALSEIHLLAINQVDILCFGDSSGSVQVLGELGTAPYSYSLDGVNYQNDQNFSNIPVGDYTFWVEDLNGCLDTLHLVFSQADELFLENFSITPVTCFAGDDGSIIFEASGGVAPYFYQLDGVNDQLLSSYEDLSSASYTISVVDDNNCQVDSVVFVGQSDSIEINIDSFSPPLCFGESNGSIEISAVGGQAPFEYRVFGYTSWNSNGTINGLSSSTYTLQARDANLCPASIEFTLEAPPELTLSINAQTNVYCNISNDGSVEMSATGGVPDYNYSINGGIYQNNPVFNGLSSGFYELTVIDQNGCIDSLDVTIEETNDLQIDEVQIQGTLCGFVNNGVLTLIASGGSAPYTFSIDGGPYQALNEFTSLNAGNHTLSLLANDGCEIDTTVFLPSISNIEITILDQVDPLCEGSNNGSIELGANNAIAPFQFSIDGGMTWQPSNQFSGLIDSSYTFIIQDQDGCLADSTINFEQESYLTMELESITSNLCPEVNNGIININGLDGILPYSYSDDGLTFNGFSIFNGLGVGDHQLWVQDGNGCIMDSLFTIGAYDSPVVLVDSLLNPTCNSFNDGVINLVADGDAIPYTYSFEGSPPSSTSYFPNLSAGNYTIDIIDLNSCFSSIELELLSAPPLVLTVDSLKHVKCKNDEEGFIFYSLVGGFGSYYYRLDGGDWEDNSISIGPLVAGTYMLEVKDDYGCIVSTSVTIDEPAELLNVNIEDVQGVQCLNDSAGVVDGLAQGGVSPYQYSLDSNLYQLSGSFSDLPPGDYTLYSIDDNNCHDQQDFAIIASSPVLLSWTSVILPSCESLNDGQLSVGVVTGVFPYTFSLNSGPDQASGTFSALSEGYYEIEVVDNLGCIAFIDTLISSEGTLSISVDSVQNINCVADSSGAIYLNASGGTAGYSYFVDGMPAPMGFLGNLTNGVYQTWVVDAIGCTDTIEAAVLQESLLQGSIFAQQNILCNNGSLGSVTVNGTTGISPYHYSIDGVNFDSINTFPDLEEGDYTIVIHDATDCEVEVDVSIELLTAIELQMQSILPSSCNGSDNGSASFFVQNGIAPYSYSIDNGILTEEFMFTDLAAGEHFVYAVDYQGCNDTIVFEIIEPEPLTINVDSIGIVSCFGMSDAYISISTDNAIGNVLYTIYPDGSSNSEGLFEGLSEDTYLLSAIDQNLCTTDSSINISSPLPLEVNVNIIDPLDCNGDSNGVAELIVIGGIEPYSYEVDTMDFGNNPIINDLGAGSHTYLINDLNNCEISGDFSITEPDSVSLSSSIINDVSCFGLDDGSAFFIAEGGNSAYSFDLNSSIYSNNGTFYDLAPDNYTLNIFDTLFCSFQYEFTIVEPAPFQIDTTLIQDPSCYGMDNGSVTVIVENGISPFMYAVDSLVFTDDSVFTDLSSGDHIAYIEDSEGCSDSLLFEIIEPEPLTINVDSIGIVSCFGMSDAYISISTDNAIGNVLYTINPDGSSNSEGLFEGLSEDTYLLSAIDQNLCTTDSSINISSPLPLEVNVNIIDPLDCNGDSNGVAELIVIGGIEPYSYEVDTIDFGNNPIINDLGAGSHTYLINDLNNCEISGDFSLTEPDSVSLSSSIINDVSCFGLDDGSAFFIAEGGNSAYSFDLNSSIYSNNGTFYDLAPDNYTLNIFDTLFCSFQYEFTIVEPVPFQIDTTLIQAPSCYGMDNGSVTVIVENGISPFMYAVDSPVFTDDSIFTDLSSGDHIAYIEDSEGCSDSLLFEISEPGPITIIIDSIGLSSCFGMSDAYISISTDNAIGNVLYTINPDGSSNSVGLFEGLSDNTYLLSVVDDNMCTTDSSVTINSPSFMDVDVNVIDPLNCYGDTIGVVELVVSGGFEPYTYIVDGIDFGNNSFINNLDAGSHTYLISDLNNCVITGDFSLTEADSISLSFSIINDVSCFGLNNGNAFFIASGGNGDYSFELNSSIYSDNGAFTNLAPDSYTLTVYDSLMCSLEFEFSILEPDLMVIDTILLENPLCFADTNGSVTILVSGGTADYNYFIPGIGSSTDSLFDNLEGGAYYISVTDNNGCNDSQIIILDEPDEFSIETLAVIPPLCFGDSSGVVLVQSEGGSGTHYYGLSWTSMTASSQFNSMPSGLAVIYAVDSLGCSDSTITFVPNVDPLFFGGVEDSSVSCYGSNDGVISFNPLGNGEDFLFSLDEVNWLDTSVFSDLYAGDYTFFMLDEFGCTIDTSMSLSEPDSLYISSISIFPVTCSDEFGGSISINVEGGIAPYESSLGSDIQIGSSVNFDDLSIGNYQIISSDFNNCVFILDTSLYEVDSIYATIDEVELNCYGDANGVATVNYIGGSGDYYFLWDNSSEDSTSTTQPNLAANVIYSVTVSDVLDSNCFSIAQVTPIQPPLIEFDLYSYSPSCDPEDIWMNIELVSGGVAPFQYQINDEDPVDSGVFSGLTMVSTRFEVIDTDGCFVEDWTIPENPNTLEAYFEVSENEVTMSEGEVVFMNLGTNSSFLKWDFGNEISVEGDIGDPAIAEFTTGSIEQPIHNYTEAGEFIATLTAISDFGCEDTYERSIIVEEDHRIYVPNSFTPDGDGINDVFLVQGSTIAIEGFKLSIYDRSGTAIFQSFDINIGWEGLGLNGNKLRPDVYVFMVTYYSGGRLFEKNGTVTLLR